MFRKRRPPVGARPGSLRIDESALKPRITITHFDSDSCHTEVLEDVEQLASVPRDRDKLIWVSVNGFGDEHVLRRIGEIFEIHPLAIADAVNVPSRPKFEDYETYSLVITVAVTLEKHCDVKGEQLSVMFGDDFVLTFQEKQSEILRPVHQRLERGQGLIRKAGSAYLATAILDAAVDGYYPVLETIGEYLEKLEREVINKPTKHTLRLIYNAKRELLSLRRYLWPTREALNSLLRSDSPFLKSIVLPYVRDCYDHCVQMIDVLETYRELAAGFMDVYLSGQNNRLNEVMKILTMISTIFIPLSFLASVYGMNFEHMPELRQRWAYPIFWIVITIVALMMVRFFRKKEWL